MKVIAFQTDEQMIVSMSFIELQHLTGCEQGEFGSKHKISIGRSSSFYGNTEKTDMIGHGEFKVSEMYKEARETLAEYKELKTKFDSIRGQLSGLLNKMRKVEKE